MPMVLLYFEVDSSFIIGFLILISIPLCASLLFNKLVLHRDDTRNLCSQSQLPYASDAGVTVSLETDIYQKIEHDFGANANAAIEQIDQLEAITKGLIDNRLLRAMIYLANGNLDGLTTTIERGRKNYRDVLCQAEYDGGEVRIHDFNKSFHELGLIARDT